MSRIFFSIKLTKNYKSCLAYMVFFIFILYSLCSHLLFSIYSGEGVMDIVNETHTLQKKYVDSVGKISFT